MKVALISPYSEFTAGGIRIISAYLKANGVSTRLIFLPVHDNYYSREKFHLYPDAVIENVAELLKNIDLVGISLMSHYFNSVRVLTRKLKARFPKKLFLWGGIHATIAPEQCIELADYVCIGEGEIPCLELCKCLEKGRSTDNINGIWSKKNGHIFKNKPSNVIMDLSRIPPQDYDLADDYILTGQKDLARLSLNNIKKYLGITYYTMYTRGCPFSCSYCCSDALGKINENFKKIRFNSPQAMVNEIKTIRDKFPFLEYVNFQDDALFALSIENLTDFCEHYKKNIDIPFFVPGVHPNIFSVKKFDLLVDSGMIRIRMGIQSGSHRILKDIFNRNQRNEKVIEVSRMLQKYRKKISMPNYDFILDNPWETQEDKIETIKLLDRLEPPFSLNIFKLVFFPGTRIYEKAKQEKMLGHEEQLTNYLSYEPTYLNLIVAMYAIFKIPSWLLKFLLSKPLVNTKHRFVLLHRIFYKLMLYRRALCYLATRDFAMFPTKLQPFFCKILPPRRFYGQRKQSVVKQSDVVLKNV